MVHFCLIKKLKEVYNTKEKAIRYVFHSSQRHLRLFYCICCLQRFVFICFYVII